MARMSPVLPIVGGNTKFQPVYVDDVAQAAVLALRSSHTPGIYELGGPEILSFSELMKKMLTVIIDMFKKEHRDTFKNLSFAVIGMRTRIYRSLGLNEEDFFNNWKK